MAEERTVIIKDPWFKAGCILGEGPLYDPTTSLLHFVDISEKKVFHLNTRSFELSVEEFTVPISCLALRRNGVGLGCTTAEGFALLEGNSTITYLCKPLTPQEMPFTRFNDGACDSQGRFFAGTICNPEKDLPGKLYRYDPIKHACDIVDEGPFTDSNGLGWSPDEKIFYFTDSLVNKIYAYDYGDGNLGNRQVFVDAIERGFAEKTYCDGLCIDEEGGIWSARWGGSRVVRFDRSGNVDFQIHIPTALNVTSCCFGGPNNDQMYITTAHCSANGGDESRQGNYPDSGHIFLADLSGLFRGLERFRFAA
ncbi:regucalcin [Gymnopilus junonius]|uniref:Regucalcin n=1 Tax=Gymnopilus junonius TaxID=109634 RepID=A0A9P5P076_GYMJU|nr:regucalcin [Gymnopilus junonius]